MPGSSTDLRLDIDPVLRYSADGNARAGLCSDDGLPTEPGSSRRDLIGSASVDETDCTFGDT
jgi:hypothetical protein